MDKGDSTLGVSCMKTYFEYEDGTFWAIRTRDSDCFAIHDSKYTGWNPEWMLEAGIERKNNLRIMSNAEKISCDDPNAAKREAERRISEKSQGALKQDAEFWHIAIEINAFLLFFVPDEHKTKELCSLAVRRNGRALQYVPVEMQDKELCTLAVNNNSLALKFMKEDLKTSSLCEKAVSLNGGALEFVPNRFKTAELCHTAVKENGWALEFVPEEMKT